MRWATTPSARDGVTLHAETLVPGGLQPPAHIPADVFARAIATFTTGHRLDMGQLAEDLGWSRATLYRKAPPREALLGEVVWYLTRHALVGAIESCAALSGGARIATSAARLLSFVSEQPAFRTFLANEPDLALRVLTSKHGPVQRGMAAATEALLAEEANRGNLKLSEDAHTLAYAIVRIGEGFLYADVLADEPPDPDTASRVIALLLSPLEV